MTIRPDDGAALDELDAQIDALESELLEAHRDDVNVAGDERACELAGARAAMLEWRLKDLLLLSRRLNRAHRKSRCRAHGDALRVTCTECQVAWRYQPARIVA